MTSSPAYPSLYQAMQRGSFKCGLENIHQLRQMTGYPDQSFPSIHIAGTNGKGSVSIKIASALQKAGFRIGLYTSPHLFSAGERIQINGRPIPLVELDQRIEALIKLADAASIPASFFDLMTLLAFLYFKDEEVDFAVVETGLGGRWDSTNVIQPIISVITSISIDHADFLGKTVEAIAREKAGIIKFHTPVILGKNVPYEIVEPIANALEAPLHQVSRSDSDYDKENRATAFLALEQIKKHLSGHLLSCPWDLAVQHGLAQRPPCRFEVHELQWQGISSTVIFDVAHNPDGIDKLLKKFSLTFGKRSCHVIAGFSKNKELHSVLALLCAQTSTLSFIEADNSRALPADEILRQAPAGKPIQSFGRNISQAISRAFRESQNDGGVIIVLGTFFIMGEVRQLLGFDDAIDQNPIFDEIFTKKLK